MCTPERGPTLTTAPGSGSPCDVCHEPITSSQVEHRSNGMRLHQWCHYKQSQANEQSAAAEPQPEVPRPRAA